MPSFQTLKNKFLALLKKAPWSSAAKTANSTKPKGKERIVTTPASFLEIVVEEPLLFLGLDLPFIIVSSISLKSAVALSIEMLFIHVVTMICAWFIASRIEVWQRVFITSGTSVIMMLISRSLVLKLIPDIEILAGVYLYLIALNALTLIQANFLSPKAKLPKVIKNAFLNVLSFSFIMCFISIIREFLGNGTIWGVPLSPFTKLDGIRAPYFGFILIGFLVSMLRFVNKKLSGDYDIHLGKMSSISLTSEDILAAAPPIPAIEDLMPPFDNEPKEEYATVSVVADNPLKPLHSEEVGLDIYLSDSDKEEDKT